MNLPVSICWPSADRALFVAEDAIRIEAVSTATAFKVS